MKIQVTMNEVQARLIVDALDLYSRLPMGQLGEVASFFRMNDCKRKDGSNITPAQIEKFQRILSVAKERLLGLESNSYLGIHSTHVPDRARTAWDLLRSIRNPLARMKHSQKDRPMWTDVRCDPVEKCGTEPLAKVDLIEEEEGFGF